MEMKDGESKAKAMAALTEKEALPCTSLPCRSPAATPPPSLIPTLVSPQARGYFNFDEEGNEEAGQATRATDRDTVSNLSTMRPALDVCGYLERAIQSGSLVLVVPWVADLLAMQRRALTRHSRSYNRALELLRIIYHSRNFEPAHTDFTPCRMVVLAQIERLFASLGVPLDAPGSTAVVPEYSVSQGRIVAWDTVKELVSPLFVEHICPSLEQIRAVLAVAAAKVSESIAPPRRLTRLRPERTKATPGALPNALEHSPTLH